MFMLKFYIVLFTTDNVFKFKNINCLNCILKCMLQSAFKYFIFDLLTPVALRLDCSKTVITCVYVESVCVLRFFVCLCLWLHVLVMMH